MGEDWPMFVHALSATISHPDNAAIGKKIARWIAWAGKN
jgi:hypothetical protein